MKVGITPFQVGEIVEVLMGRESGKHMIVLDVQERFVLLADGDKRKYDQAKKKNVRHIRSTGHIAQNVVESIAENGRISNAKLRFILQDYLSNYMIRDEEKGE